MVLLLPVLLVVRVFVSAPEERYLQRRFGADYLSLHATLAAVALDRSTAVCGLDRRITAGASYKEGTEIQLKPWSRPLCWRYCWFPVIPYWRRCDPAQESKRLTVLVSRATWTNSSSMIASRDGKRKRQHRQVDPSGNGCGESGLYRLHDTLRIRIRCLFNADFVIDDDGAELRVILTDPGVVESRVYREQFPGDRKE